MPYLCVGNGSHTNSDYCTSVSDRFLQPKRSVYCAVRAESSNIIRVNDRNQTSSGPHPTCLSPSPWAKQPGRVCHSFSYRNVSLCTPKSCEEMEVWIHSLLPSVLDKESASRPAHFSPAEKSLWRLGVFQQPVRKV